MQFQHINPRELTVWHLDDAEQPQREIKRFVERELPQGVEHKECLGPRDFAVSLARKIKASELRKYNAFISDGDMCNIISKENLSHVRNLGLIYLPDLDETEKSTKRVLKENLDALTSNDKMFLYGLYSGNMNGSLKTEYDPETAAENLPLNSFKLGNYFWIDKGDTLKESFELFFSHFDNMVGLRQVA